MFDDSGIEGWRQTAWTDEIEKAARNRISGLLSLFVFVNCFFKMCAY